MVSIQFETLCAPAETQAVADRCSLMPVASLLVTCGTDRMALARFHWDEPPRSGVTYAKLQPAK